MMLARIQYRLAVVVSVQQLEAKSLHIASAVGYNNREPAAKIGGQRPCQLVVVLKLTSCQTNQYII